MDIFEETIQEGFERTKEGRTRVGLGLAKKRLTPNELAGYNLFRVLEKYPGFTQDARTEIQNEFTDMDDLPVMNMETFAAVLSFLRLYPSPTPKDFRDENIVPFFERLFPDKSLTDEEKERLIVRLKAQFIKYITAINRFREEE